jgi:proteasome beta subunit
MDNIEIKPGKLPTDARGTGTTTVGITCKDGVVLATDTRATAGHLISHKDTQKLFKITEYMGLTIAGLVGDAQALARTLASEVSLYEMKHDGRKMSIKAAATSMSGLLNSRKFAPYEVALLVGGWDEQGPHVYSLDEAGGCMPDKWTTTGSGSPFVFGVLEDHYRDGLSASDAIDLAIRSLNASTHRDSASGNGFLIALINAKGYQPVPRDEMEKRLKKMGLPPLPN